MNNIQHIEEQVQELSADDLARFRKWFAGFDAAIWDRQFEADVKAGRLSAMADRALRTHMAGESTKL